MRDVESALRGPVHVLASLALDTKQHEFDTNLTIIWHYYNINHTLNDTDQTLIWQQPLFLKPLTGGPRGRSSSVGPACARYLYRRTWPAPRLACRAVSLLQPCLGSHKMLQPWDAMEIATTTLSSMSQVPITSAYTCYSAST